MMEAKLQKWGNSYGIRIPSSLLKELNIKENDLLNIKQDDKKIIIMKASNMNKVSLAKLFAQYNGENMAKDFSWDDNVGREVW